MGLLSWLFSSGDKGDREASAGEGALGLQESFYPFIAAALCMLYLQRVRVRT